jgi:hypothetical protein
MYGDDFSADRMADEFVNYLFDQYQGSRHVRRVSAWLGLVILGIESIKETWWIPRSRQLFFETNGHRYKARYSHDPRPRGGIEIIEVADTRGSPEIGQPVVTIRSLDDAKRFFANPRLEPSRQIAA